jgi:hypothetical protein
MSDTTYTLNQSLSVTVTECPDCAVQFGAPGLFLIKRRKDKRTFYCPNGHPMSFREGEADRLRKELQQAREATEYALTRARVSREAREAEERRHRATKGALTKAKKRLTAARENG